MKFTMPLQHVPYDFDAGPRSRRPDQSKHVKFHSPTGPMCTNRTCTHMYTAHIPVYILCAYVHMFVHMFTRCLLHIPCRKRSYLSPQLKLLLMTTDMQQLFSLPKRIRALLNPEPHLHYCNEPLLRKTFGFCLMVFWGCWQAQMCSKFQVDIDHPHFVPVEWPPGIKDAALV